MMRFLFERSEGFLFKRSENKCGERRKILIISIFLFAHIFKCHIFSRPALRLYGQKLTKQALVFTCLQCKSFENTVGKGEIAPKGNSSSSHKVFYPFEELYNIFITFKISVFKVIQCGRF